MPQQMAQVTAQIVIAQAGNPAPGGYSSGSRDDIVVGSAVTATNLDDTSATWHRWTVSPYYPAGTLGGLGVTGDGTATCALTPDVEGDIALTLEVAGLPLPGGGANYARQTVMLGIRAVLAGYAPGMPLPHPLEAGRGQSGAVDPAVGRDGRIDEAIYALKQGLAVAGAGTPYASTPANVATAGAAGASSDYARGDHAHRGVASVAKDGGAALYGAVTFSEGSNVTLTQVGQDIEIAASGGGGPPASITWDTANVTNSATGTYQTWAEIRTQANSTTAPLAVLVKGTPTTSGTTTDSWPHVTFKSDDAALSLTFTEGVVIKNARFDMAGIVTSTATTTTNLQYAPGAKVNLRGQFSAGTVGLLGVDGDGAVEFRLGDGSLLSTYAFHSDAGDTVNVYTGATEWEAGAVDHFEGSAGTINAYYTNETIGLPEVSAYTGTYTDTLRPYLAATRPTPPASAVVVLRLDDVAGTTSVANSGTGTAFTLGTITGTVVFGSPTPIGNGLFVQNTSYIRGAGAALTYQATTQNMTAMCWVKFGKGTTLGSGGDKAVLFGKESTAGATFALTVLQDTGQLQASIDTATGGATNTTGGYVGTDWSLVAMTYDGTTVKTYVNGVQVGSGVANTGNLVWDNTKSWQVGNNANNALFTLRECWFHNAVLTLDEIQAIYHTGAFNGAIGVLDAQSLQGVDVDPTAPSAGDALVYDGAAWVPTALPTRGVVASLEWSATAGVFTTVSSLNIAGRVAYDYGSGTNSLKVTLTNAVTNGIPHAHADPDWVDTFHVDAVPVMVSGTEIRIDFRNKGDTQIAPADGAGILTVIGDL